jgi:hypothetical protein
MNWYKWPIAELQHRDAIRDQALGVAYAANDLDLTARYEVTWTANWSERWQCFSGCESFDALLIPGDPFGRTAAVVGMDRDGTSRPMRG